MNKELVKKETEETLPAELMEAFGSENIDNEDIILPKLLLMQAMSEAVNEKETAEAGDILKSTTEVVLGGRSKPVEIIPVSLQKSWVVMKKEGSKFEFVATEPVTAQNANRPLTWTDELHNEFRADKCLNFYVLLKSEVAAAVKGEGAAIPCVVSFRRTSYQAGRKLASGIAESKFMKQPAFAKSYELRAEKKTNDLGTFFVFDIVPKAKTSVEEMKYAFEWYKNLNAAQVKVHEAGDDA